MDPKMSKQFGVLRNINCFGKSNNFKVSSSFIENLTPDELLSSVSMASSLVRDEKFGSSSTSPSTSASAEEKHQMQVDEIMHTPRIISSGAHFAYCLPEIRRDYKTLFKSTKAYQDLQLPIENELAQSSNETSELNNKNDIEKIMNGQDLIITDKIYPYSMAYAGFQFGTFAGQLGDGRVVNLFELNGNAVQIKGSGLTPFSRFADGKAVLRSSIREFIISETLSAIGIPSTRALQLTLLPGTRAQRGEGFEPCAQVTRFAPSWVRIGNFDLQRWRQNAQGLIKLADYCIDYVMPKDMKMLPLSVFTPTAKGNASDSKNTTQSPIPGMESSTEQQKKDDFVKSASFNPQDLTKYDEFFRKVIILNAKTVGYWQAYGFLNGVLNTDNTSILGLSLDFGPFSFMDRFDPRYTPNHDDFQLRYCLQEQPSVIWWNLQKLAQSLVVLLGSGPQYIDVFLQEPGKITEEMAQHMTERVQSMLEYNGNEYKFWVAFYTSKVMSERLGLKLFPEGDLFNESDYSKYQDIMNKVNTELLEPLWEFLYLTKIDYNNFFIDFQNYNDYTFFTETNGKKIFKKDFVTQILNTANNKELSPGLVEYLATGEFSQDNVLDIDTETDYREIEEKLRAWTGVYTEMYEQYNIDQTQGQVSLKLKRDIASKVNPVFTPRSFMFEEVIDDYVERQRDALHDPEAKIDNSLLEKLFLMSTNPYDPSKWKDSLHPATAKKWMAGVSEEDNVMQQCGCSS